MIQQLAANGYALAVASSANPKRVKLFLDRLGLAHYFEVVVHGDDVLKGKPDPEVFLTAASKIGAKPYNCVVIEDAKVGVKAAKAAKMFCIGFAGLPHNKEDLSEADVIVTDFDVLTKHIKMGRRFRDL